VEPPAYLAYRRRKGQPLRLAGARSIEERIEPFLTRLAADVQRTERANQPTQLRYELTLRDPWTGDPLPAAQRSHLRLAERDGAWKAWLSLVFPTASFDRTVVAIVDAVVETLGLPIGPAGWGRWVRRDSGPERLQQLRFDRLAWPVTERPDEAALLAQIAADPDADPPRRVYADRLVARGDPRGQLIHVQCELARRRAAGEPRAAWHALEAEERWLLEAHAERWAHPLQELEPRLVRGMIGRIRMPSPEDFVAAAARLFAFAPGLRELQLARPVWTSGASALVACPEVRRLTALRLQPLPGTLEVLAGSPALANLTRLKLNAVLDLIGALRGSSGLGRVEALHLDQPRLDADGLAEVVGLGSLPSLDRLHVYRCAFTRGIERLTGAPPLARLRSLTLRNCGLDDAALRTLADSPHLSGLVDLRIPENRFGLAGLTALIASERLPSLRLLDVTGCPLDDRAAAQLAAMPGLARLRSLAIDAYGAAMLDPLAASPYLDGLEELSVPRYALREALTARFGPALVVR
jgi:uncharacterized protein (TIGR02996 family)